MNVYAIADLHLSLREGILTKPMSRFGAQWQDHHTRVAENWRQRVTDDDLVLLPGDFSWATRPEQAAEDLAWLEALPGRKVLIKGNHDYWMPSSRSKLRAALPPSVQCLQNDSLLINGVLLVGSRLWNIPGLHFDIAWQGDTGGELAEGTAPDPEQDARILARELQRLQLSFDHARQAAAGRRVNRTICMTHYPPVDFNGRSSEASDMIAAFGVEVCLFGHLHSLEPGPATVTVDGVSYHCVSADFVGFDLVVV